MQLTIYDWLDHEWLALRAEGQPNLAVEEQTRDIFGRMDASLKQFGLAPEDIMRTRLWARERDARDRGSRVRAETLSGRARSASSSFIEPDYFDSSAAVAVELWAMKPRSADSQKQLVEHEPAIVPLRYLRRESMLVLSGVTSVLPTLAEQMTEIERSVHASLSLAQAGWSRVVRVSAHLHHSVSLAEFRPLIRSFVEAGPELEFGFVEGYSTPGKLVEIEVTARTDG